MAAAPWPNTTAGSMNLNKLSKFLLTPLLAVLAFTARADVPGYTEPYKTITVSAAEAGVIRELPVEEGSVVKQGQILARLDVAQLDAELEIAKIQGELQRTKVERLDELARSQRAAKEELERSRADLKIREAEIRKIQAAIETRTMRSPVNGIVTEIKRDQSEAVSLSNPHVLTVVQIDRLIVNLFLPPSRAQQLKLGGSATLALGENSSRVPATVEFISPITDAASGTVRVKFVMDNTDRKLRSGITATLAE
jgi:RND family efflux transporter MFP subunit